MIYHANIIHRKMGVARLISDGTDFRARKGISNKEEHFIRIKGSILQGGIIVLNLYSPSNKASKYVRPKLIKVQGKVYQLHYYSCRLQHTSIRIG